MNTTWLAQSDPSATSVVIEGIRAVCPLSEELQRNPQLKQLAASGLLKWSDLMNRENELTVPDGGSRASWGRIDEK